MGQKRPRRAKQKKEAKQLLSHNTYTVLPHRQVPALPVVAVSSKLDQKVVPLYGDDERWVCHYQWEWLSNAYGVVLRGFHQKLTSRLSGPEDSTLCHHCRGM